MDWEKIETQNNLNEHCELRSYAKWNDDITSIWMDNEALCTCQSQSLQSLVIFLHDRWKWRLYMSECSCHLAPYNRIVHVIKPLSEILRIQGAKKPHGRPLHQSISQKDRHDPSTFGQSLKNVKWSCYYTAFLFLNSTRCGLYGYSKLQQTLWRPGNQVLRESACLPTFFIVQFPRCIIRLLQRWMTCVLTHSTGIR